MKFTIEQVDDALRQVIDAQPDFTYTDSGAGMGCYYNHGPSGNIDKCDGCVFGQAFQLLGIPKETLEMCGGINSVSYYFLPPTEQRPSYWGDIQTDQDQGRAWHTLLEYLPTTK